MVTPRQIFSLIVIAGSVGTSVSAEGQDRRSFVAAMAAHTVCGGYFVVGRDHQRPIDDVIARDLEPFPWFAFDRATYTVSLDEGRGVVAVGGEGFAGRVAQYNDDQGCTILPAGEPSVFFEPHDVTSTLPDAMSQDWPTGDRNSRSELAGAAGLALDEALDRAMGVAGQNTRALVVLHHGFIVGERYSEGFGPHTPQISWSQGKSLTATLAAVLMAQGYFHWTDPAPVVEWQGDEDPRRHITIANLLNMSSGLDFHNYGMGTDSSLTTANEHWRIYFDALNVFDHAINQPLDIAVNSQMRYRNSDPLALGRVIRRTIEGRGDLYHQFAQTDLFDRIGIRDAVLETDPWGNYIMTGYDYLSAMDWARFGLLYLQEGFWEGERILPDGWVDFVRTPAPADPSLNYGGMFWLNRGGALPDVPDDAYWSAGFMGQFTYIIPSESLVVVRLGPSSGGADAYMNAVIAEIISALDE